jgi:hypothetical protein
MNRRDSLLSTFWHFVRPQVEEVIAYVVVLVIIGGIATYQLAVNGQIGSDSLDITASLHNAITTTTQYMSQGSGWAKFFLFGFWFIVGGIVYAIAWAIITIVVDIRNDIRISSTFIHPRSFHQSDFWLSVVARTLLRAVSGIALLFYAVFWLWVFGPVWVNVDQRLVNDLGNTKNLINFGLSIVGVVLTLHIATILMRLALLRPSRDYDEE